MKSNIKKYTAEEIKVIQAHMASARNKSPEEQSRFIAQTVGEVCDVEMPIMPFIQALSRDITATNRPEDNHVYYLTPVVVDKKVYTLDSNCNVTQIQVTPQTRTELSFTEITSPDFWICLRDFLRGDHDALQLFAESAIRSLDLKEAQLVLSLMDAAVTTSGNSFVNASGQTRITYDVLVEMVRSLAKYGTKFVAIAGANVATDLKLMQYRTDRHQDFSFEELGITLYTIEDYTVDTNGSGQTAVIDPDALYIIAQSDACGNRPLVFARRSLDIMSDCGNIIQKERYVAESCPPKNVGATVKWARGYAVYEDIGMVWLNNYVIAKYTN